MRPKGIVDPIAVPVCDWRTFITAKPEAEQATLDALDAYFSNFAQPTFKPELDEEGRPLLDNQPCLGCGTPMAGFLIGSFQWGIANGWGNCSNCKYPAAVYHFIADDIILRGVLLQVHPAYIAKSAAEPWEPRDESD